MISSLGAELGKKHHLLCPEINAFHAEVPVKKKEKNIVKSMKYIIRLQGSPQYADFGMTWKKIALHKSQAS